VGDLDGFQIAEQNFLLALQPDRLLRAGVGWNERGAVARAERGEEPRGGFLRLLEAFAVSAPRHAERIIQHERDAGRPAAGEKPGAGLENGAREQEDQNDDRGGPEREQQPVAQPLGARDALLREQDELDRGEADALDAAAVQKVDDDRKRRREEAEEVERVQEKQRHRLRSPAEIAHERAVERRGVETSW